MLVGLGMRTAEQIIDENIIEYIWESNLDNIPITKVLQVMKIYAKQVAEQALKDASENASMIDKGTPYFDNYSIDKESILNTEIKTP